MGLIEIVVVIALVGLFVWAVQTLIPMPPPFQKAIYVVCVVGLVLWLLSSFGLLSHLHNIKIGK